MTDAPLPGRSPVAFLFAGLGSQQVGMGRGLAQASEPARALFQAADDALGQPLSKLAAEGPEADLDRPEHAAPALVACGVADARHLIGLGQRPQALLGYGVGHLAALAVADAISFADAIGLARAAARFAREAVGSGEHGAAAVVGVERSLVREICQNIMGLGPVEIAGHNAPGQTLIAGTRGAVGAAADRCEEEFGSAIPVRIGVPLHTSLVAGAEAAWRALVDGVALSAPALLVVDPAAAAQLADVAAVRESLRALLVQPVLFEESLAVLAGRAVERLVQCGPGSTLLGYARRVLRSAQSLDPFEVAAGLIV